MTFQNQLQNSIFFISDCLQKFVDVEELAESERFFCNTCKSKQRSTKKFWIRRLPNVSFSAFFLKPRDFCDSFDIYYRSCVCILRGSDGALIHVPRLTLTSLSHCRDWTCRSICYLTFTRRVAQIQDQASMIWQLL